MMKNNKVILDDNHIKINILTNRVDCYNHKNKIIKSYLYHIPHRWYRYVSHEYNDNIVIYFIVDIPDYTNDWRTNESQIKEKTGKITIDIKSNNIMYDEY